MENLKKFITRIGTFSLLFVGFYFLVTTAMMNFAPFTTAQVFYKHDWLRVNKRIATSMGSIKGDTIYVGCSVASQLLPYNKNNQLTSNGSTYPIGNYFLIKNAMEHNPTITTVIYLAVPDVIGHRLTRERTYNYFVKPFYTFENRSEILASKPARTVLQQNPLLDLCVFDAFKLLTLDDYNYSDGEAQFKYSLSDEAFDWLLKMDSLCVTNDVAFHIASPPVPLHKKMESEDWAQIKRKVNGTKLQSLFTTYFETIQYLDDKYLKDHIHWNDSLIKTNRKQYVRSILTTLRDHS